MVKWKKAVHLIGLKWFFGPSGSTFRHHLLCEAQWQRQAVRMSRPGRLVVGGGSNEGGQIQERLEDNGMKHKAYSKSYSEMF